MASAPVATDESTSAATGFAPHEETFQERVATLNRQVNSLEEFMLTLTQIECPACQDSRCCDAHRAGGSEELTIILELRTKIESLGQHNRQRSQNLNDVEKEVRSLIEALKVRNKARLASLKTMRDEKKLAPQPENFCSSCVVS